MIPPLPATDQAWPPSIHHAAKILGDIYNTASNVLASGNYDLHRIQYHHNTIIDDALSLLLEVEKSSSNDGEQLDLWLQACVQIFAELLVQLAEAEEQISGVCVICIPFRPLLTSSMNSESSNVNYPNPVSTHHSGRHGRPCKIVNLDFLQDALNPKRRIALETLANKLGMHRNTLRYKLKALGVDTKFSSLPDKDLDILVKVFQEQRPDSGLRYLTGFLRKHGLRVQKRRVHAAVNRVNRLGQELRRRTRIKTVRKSYEVSRPNALWHIDGHHKLIHWGIVIHGCVDGYSRAVSRYAFVTKFKL